MTKTIAIPSVCGALFAILGLPACGSRTPTTPSEPRSTSAQPTAQPAAPPLPPSRELFTFMGQVADDQGSPVVGAGVTIRSAGGATHASALTDASGRYTIELSASPWTNSAGQRIAARAEIIADGFDWFYRDVPASGPQLVEDFRLHRVKRISAGDSVIVSVSSENGDCTGWLYRPCGRARVTAPATGDLLLEASVTADSESREPPRIEACCVNGDEVQGNPVTLPVQGGVEIWVEIGQSKAGIVTRQTVLLTSSLRLSTPFP